MERAPAKDMSSIVGSYATTSRQAFEFSACPATLLLGIMGTAPIATSRRFAVLGTHVSIRSMLMLYPDKLTEETTTLGLSWLCLMPTVVQSVLVVGNQISSVSLLITSTMMALNTGKRSVEIREMGVACTTGFDRTGSLPDFRYSA